MKRALITGIAGFAGSHLASNLVDEGWEVTGIERHGAVLDAPVFLLNKIRVEECDILSAQDVGRVIRKHHPEVIFHLAGTSVVPMAQSAPQLAFETNVKGSLNVLEETCANAPVARVILVSSAEVYGKVPTGEMPLTEEKASRPASIYGLTKLCAEEAAFYYSRARSLDAVILRPFNHIGPGQRPSFVTASFAFQIAKIEAGRQEPFLEVGNLDAFRDFTDVRDMVRAYRLAVDHCAAATPYNVCSGRTYMIKEILDKLLALTKSAIEVRQDKGRLREAEIPLFQGEHSRFTSVTGWQPEYGIDETLEAILDYWRDQMKKGIRDYRNRPRVGSDG